MLEEEVDQRNHDRRFQVVVQLMLTNPDQSLII